MDQTAYFEQMRNRRKKEILTVAKEMFLKQGVATFSMQQLAKNLDISTVTLYKYFKNMDDILQELKTEIFEKLSELLFLKSTEHKNSSMLIFLHQIKVLYDIILKNRTDISLLILIEINTRSNNKDTNTNENIQFIYKEKWNEQMLKLLVDIKTQGLLKPELTPENALQFINQTNEALLLRIGILSDTQFKKEAQLIKQQLEQTLELFSIYLTK